MTNSLKDRLITALENEELHFNMEHFFTTWDVPAPTCGTASCMAGHIIALTKPDIIPNEIHVDSNTARNTAEFAAKTWKEVSGEPCLLDFYGERYRAKDLKEITREDAIAHIRGEHPEWPQYAKEEDVDNS